MRGFYLFLLFAFPLCGDAIFENILCCCIMICVFILAIIVGKWLRAKRRQYEDEAEKMRGKFHPDITEEFYHN